MNTEKTILIKRLKEANLSLRCFLKVDMKKAAFELEWQKHLYTPEELTNYPRWGIAGGNGLVPIDTDNDEMSNIIREILPPTFEAISPRRKLPHFYFKVVHGEVPNKILHLPEEKKGSGEIRSQNQYLVAPGTVIKFKDIETSEEKTGTYKILNDRSIATVCFEDFMRAVTPYFGSDTTQKITFEQMREGVPQGTRHSQGMKYASFLVKVQKFDGATALTELKRWNKLCEPPMDEHDLERMVKKAIDYPERRTRQKKKESTPVGAKLGSYRLKKKHNKAFLFDEEDKPVLSCNLDSVDGPRFKKKLRELTGLEEAEVNRATASFSFALQSIRKSHSSIKENEETEEEEPKFSEDIEANITVELQRILEAKDQLEALKPHLDNVIMGEDENKQAIQVLLSGSKYADIKKKQIILLKGTAGGGKTTLARELSRNFKVKEVGRFSSHALDYSNLEGFEVLFLKELGAMDMEKQGVSTLKFLSADDRGYTVEVTVRDEETGKFTTEQHKIPCMTVISTTTRLILDPQFERRAWLFNIDETKEQTKNILEWKANQKRQDDEKLLGIRTVTDYEFSREIINRFVQQLKPQKIIIPFRKTLNDVLQADILRIRGDVDKLHSFVELYGLLNLKRLEKANSDVYMVTPKVCMDALKITIKPLTQMLSKIDERTKIILDTLKDFKLNKAQDMITKTERERIAVLIGKSERTVLSYLNFLENVGFLSSDSKKPKTFTLLYDVETMMGKLSGISAKLESADALVSKMEKEAQEWLGSTSETRKLRDTYILNKNNEKPKQQDTMKKNNIPIPRETISDLKLSLKQAWLTEKPSEDLQIGKSQIIQADSWILKREGNKITAKDGNVLYECQFCRGCNKPMFFNSEEDLKLHILRLHSGYPNREVE